MGPEAKVCAKTLRIFFQQAHHRLSMSPSGGGLPLVAPPRNQRPSNAIESTRANVLCRSFACDGPRGLKVVRRWPQMATHDAQENHLDALR
eukprot:6855582-Pyramimonas_sp.AAC.1